MSVPSENSFSSDIKLRVQQLLNARPHEALKDLEMKEIHGEEKYIRTLRRYSEKVRSRQIDVFKKELDVREDLIGKLQEELGRLKDVEIQAKAQIKYVGDLEKQKEKLSTSLAEMREYTEKQMQEYESSIEFLERDRDLMRETLEQQESSHRIESEQLTLKVQELESSLETEKREREICETALEQEKDIQANLQDEIMRYARSWKALEKILKDQVSELSQENLEYEEKFQSQMDTIKQLEGKIDEFQTLDDLLQKEQDAVKG